MTRSWRVLVVAGLIAIGGSAAVRALTGFHYNPFRDPFDLGRLVIDLVVWISIYSLAYWFLTGNAKR